MPAPADSYGRSSFNSGTFYIIDDVEPRHLSQEDCDTEPDQHRSNCERIRKLFKDFSNYRIKSVTFSEDSGPADFWTTELKRKDRNDLVIIYYHGRAGNCGKRYSWVAKEVRGMGRGDDENMETTGMEPKTADADSGQASDDSDVDEAVDLSEGDNNSQALFCSE
ncbi:hypothetical protein LTR37_003003 [Vermiconidia calcicola]|uniref:Uncharacterized protein n=1 Tax=Vermiconidia calcicola TaxID=1690605 RepID=A0ACC3NR05_9PEZI|nr:hypothetical protein LTR37_003003 [Vermiconidia calcicola]